MRAKVIIPLILFVLLLGGLLLYTSNPSAFKGLLPTTTNAEFQSFNKEVPISLSLEEMSPNNFRLTWVGQNITITEQYQFTENALSATGIGLKLSGAYTFQNIAEKSYNKINPSYMSMVDVGVYNYKDPNTKSLLFKNIDKLSPITLRQAVDKYKTENMHVTGTAGNIPLIYSIGGDTLEMEKYFIHLGVGEVSQLAIAKCPEGYANKLRFSSSDTSFVKVDECGNITGVSNGTAVITVSLDGAALYNSVTVNVY